MSPPRRSLPVRSRAPGNAGRPPAAGGRGSPPPVASGQGQVHRRRATAESMSMGLPNQAMSTDTSGGTPGAARAEEGGEFFDVEQVRFRLLFTCSPPP